MRLVYKTPFKLKQWMNKSTVDSWPKFWILRAKEMAKEEFLPWVLGAGLSPDKRFSLWPPPCPVRSLALPGLPCQSLRAAPGLLAASCLSLSALFSKLLPSEVPSVSKMTHFSLIEQNSEVRLCHHFHSFSLSSKWLIALKLYWRYIFVFKRRCIVEETWGKVEGGNSGLVNTQSPALLTSRLSQISKFLPSAPQWWLFHGVNSWNSASVFKSPATHTS